jgi:hypothetical protein
MAEINDLTIVDASNTARFPELMAPSAVNNGARALEGLVARWHRDLNASVTTGGTSTVYTYAANRTVAAYYDGLMLGVDFHTATGAAPTINVDSLGAKNLVWPNGTALAANDIATGGKALIVYDGTSFQVLTTNAEASITKANIQNQSFSYLADSGAADAYVITLVPAVTAYVAGQRFSFLATNANTTTSTLNVNGLGVKTIKKNGGANNLDSGDIIAAQMVDVEYDGTDFQMVSPPATSGVIDIQSFTASGTWTKSSYAATSRALVQLWGSGGSGGMDVTPGGAGGGGGGYQEAWFPLSALGATETVTINSGGAAVTSIGFGNAGGTSTFGSLLTAYGGGGGGGHNGTTPGGGGGGGVLAVGADGAGSSAGAGGEPNGGAAGSTSAGGASGMGGGGGGHSTGGIGGAGVWGGGGGGAGLATALAGGASIMGGGGGGGAGTTAGAAGGASVNGGAGGAGSTTTGTDGTQPGGGGGGAISTTSGAGADGQCIVTVFPA